MSNGFEMCDNHTYLFATEGKDCPYCEIDRLKGELEKAHTELAISIKERIDLGNQLAEARAEIHGLGEIIIDHKRQLAEAKEHMRLAGVGPYKANYTIEGLTLNGQLAEARAEVERLNKDLGWANKQIQLKDLELDQAMVQIEISSDISCQEVAREIIQYIEDQGMIDAGTVARPMLVYEIAKCNIAEIKTRFKLEG